MIKLLLGIPDYEELCVLFPRHIKQRTILFHILNQHLYWPYNPISPTKIHIENSYNHLFPPPAPSHSSFLTYTTRRATTAGKNQFPHAEPHTHSLPDWHRSHILSYARYIYSGTRARSRPASSALQGAQPFIAPSSRARRGNRSRVFSHSLARARARVRGSALSYRWRIEAAAAVVAGIVVLARKLRIVVYVGVGYDGLVACRMLKWEVELGRSNTCFICKVERGYEQVVMW